MTAVMLLLLVLVFAQLGIVALLSMARSAKQKAATAKMIAANKRSRGGGGSKSGPKHGGGKKLPKIPMASLIQAFIVIEAATGMRADDIIFPLIDLILGRLTAEQFKSQCADWLQAIIAYWIQNPSDVMIQSGIAVFWTSLLRTALAKAGVKKYFNVAGMFLIEVR